MSLDFLIQDAVRACLTRTRWRPRSTSISGKVTSTNLFFLHFFTTDGALKAKSATSDGIRCCSFWCGFISLLSCHVKVMIFLTKKNQKQKPWWPYLLNLRPDLLFPGGAGTPPIPDIPPPILPNGPNDVPQPPAPKDLFAVGKFLY